jgi:hypothetical protein
VLSHVFNPATLTAPRLFHIGPYDPATGEAKQYNADGTYAEYVAPVDSCDNLPPNVGAGGWAMSAKDLIRYLTSVDGLPTPPDILSTTERTAMLHSPRSDNPSDTALVAGYGRGWQLGSWGACNSGWNIVQGHNGGIRGGFSNMYFRQPGSGERGNLPAERRSGQVQSAAGRLRRRGPALLRRRGDRASDRSDPPDRLAELRFVLSGARPL